MNKPIRILSFGGGVQSSTLALMALHGDIESIDYAIFADTGSEPQRVYEHIEWMKEQIGEGFPLIVTSKGNLGDDVLSAQMGDKKRCAQPPFFVIDVDTTEVRVQPKQTINETLITANMLPEASKFHSLPDKGGVLWRQCTKEYKIEAIRREARRIYEQHGKERRIQQIIGISFDERQRMRDSGVGYIDNVYPLADAKISRHDCLEWLRKHGYPEPPKSACFFCPYTSNRRWADMKRNDPETFQRAIEFDAALRDGDRRLPGVTGRVYVHRSFKPLSDIVFVDDKQGDFDFGFDNECEGMCGV